MADYLAGFYPEWVDKEENPRQIILDLGKMITNRIPVKLGFQKLNKYDPEYWGLAALLTDEQAEVALKMGVRKPKTMADMVKLTGKSEEELEKILGDMPKSTSSRPWAWRSSAALKWARVPAIFDFVCSAVCRYSNRFDYLSGERCGSPMAQT